MITIATAAVERCELVLSGAERMTVMRFLDADRFYTPNATLWI